MFKDVPFLIREEGGLEYFRKKKKIVWTFAEESLFWIHVGCSKVYHRKNILCVQRFMLSCVYLKIKRWHASMLEKNKLFRFPLKKASLLAFALKKRHCMKII